MVLKRDVLHANVSNFKKAFPNVEPFYAVKANPDESVLEELIKVGSSFDCASFEEIDRVLKLGGSANNIIFANPVKFEDDIINARKVGVQLFCVDNIYEVEKMAKFAPGAKVLVRLCVPDSGSQVRLSQKFGIDSSLAANLLKKAESLGLAPYGLSFHVGSQCMRIENFSEALNMSKAVYEDCLNLGIHLRILDIGGGFPIAYDEKARAPSYQDIYKFINMQLTWFEGESLKIIAEPGRSWVATAGCLITRVIGKAERQGKVFYYLDDGLYQDFSGMVYDHCHYPIKTYRKGPLQESVLAGPTCDSFDMIDSSIMLPELSIGDVIIVNCMGAYSNASARSGFNGLEAAKVIMI